MQSNVGEGCKIMTKRKHDYQYYKDVERAAFSEELRKAGFISSDLRGFVMCSEVGQKWSIPLENRKPTIDLLQGFCGKCNRLGCNVKIAISELGGASNASENAR